MVLHSEAPVHFASVTTALAAAWRMFRVVHGWRYRAYPCGGLKSRAFVTKKQVIFSGLVAYADMARRCAGKRSPLMCAACCFTFPVFGFSDESATNEI
ncbi:hypothetical protein I6G96_21160 [Delftia acidovorans]|nr:hypothetical protein [Delftia acidovorans]QPR33443.1 hypothetical protein I6G96_21160 [Delftia acidovorans]